MGGSPGAIGSTVSMEASGAAVLFNSSSAVATLSSHSGESGGGSRCPSEKESTKESMSATGFVIGFSSSSDG